MAFKITEIGKKAPSKYALLQLTYGFHCHHNKLNVVRKDIIPSCYVKTWYFCISKYLKSITYVIEFKQFDIVDIGVGSMTENGGNK